MSQLPLTVALAGFSAAFAGAMSAFVVVKRRRDEITEANRGMFIVQPGGKLIIYKFLEIC